MKKLKISKIKEKNILKTLLILLGAWFLQVISAIIFAVQAGSDIYMQIIQLIAIVAILCIVASNIGGYFIFIAENIDNKE